LTLSASISSAITLPDPEIEAFNALATPLTWISPEPEIKQAKVSVFASICRSPDP